jgi:hypothetical protein
MLELAFRAKLARLGRSSAVPHQFSTGRPRVQLLIVPEAESHVVGALRK